STASQGFPPSSDASSAITATYGGVLAAVPIPAGWKVCRDSDHSADAPPQAGTSAPPPSGPVPSSDRAAARGMTASPRDSHTPGVDQERVVLERALGGLVAADHVHREGLRQRTGGELSELAERMAGGDLSPQPGPDGVPSPGPAAPGGEQPQRPAGHPHEPRE